MIVSSDVDGFCSDNMYCCWDATVNIKQPMPTIKFPSTFISSALFPFEKAIAIALVKISKSSGLKSSIIVNITPPNNQIIILLI